MLSGIKFKSLKKFSSNSDIIFWIIFGFYNSEIEFNFDSDNEVKEEFRNIKILSFFSNY